jgi:hypothetical protein
MEHQAKWDVCTGSRQSKTLMRYLLFSRGNELLVVSTLRLRAAVGLLTGHNPNSSHVQTRSQESGRTAECVMIQKTATRCVPLCGISM